MNYRQMLTGDLVAEIAYWHDILHQLTTDIDNAPGWLVALCDEYINAASAEIKRRHRAKTAPTALSARLNPEHIKWAAEDTDLVDLIQRESGNSYRRVSSNNGGQWAGPCPWCGGDDRFCIWNNAERPRYWCRQCGRGGDAIQFMRDYHGMSFPDAVRELARRMGREIAPARRKPRKSRLQVIK